MIRVLILSPSNCFKEIFMCLILFNPIFYLEIGARYGE